jgi:cytoskeletal protein CcmA (bactofilin family)
LKSRNMEIGKDEVTIIGNGVVLEGKLMSNGNIRVDGVINGDVNANGNVTVGENGEINGEINAENITIGGKVIGRVNAKEKLTLESKCNLRGDLVTKLLVVEAGAKFDGNSNMGNREIIAKQVPPPSES